MHLTGANMRLHLYVNGDQIEAQGGGGGQRNRGVEGSKRCQAGGEGRQAGRHYVRNVDLHLGLLRGGLHHGPGGCVQCLIAHCQRNVSGTVELTVGSAVEVDGGPRRVPDGAELAVDHRGGRALDSYAP
jgi:hypothetical protein